MRNNTRGKKRNSRRNPHMAGVLVDVAHVVLCVGIVIFAVTIFLNPEQFQRFFPIVFGLAAVMQFLHGIPKLFVYRRSHGGDRGALAAGVLLSILGALLLIMAAISAVTIWS